MLIVPALDLRGGACIRMCNGSLASAIIYDADPVRRAISFVAAGAKRLHVVDIDAAMGLGDNLATIARLCRAVDVPVQAGGGIRSRERALALVGCGVADIILGTVLIEDHMLAARLADGLPGHAFAAIDARGGRVATRGWNGESTIDLRTLIARVSELGIGRIIFTEIARDGTGEGFDVDALASVAHSTDCRITASGGARTMDDVRRLELLTPTNLDSCIVGTALYQGTMQLSVLDPA